MLKTEYASVFARRGPNNSVNTMFFAAAGKKKIIITVALGFRGAENIGIYGAFGPRVSKQIAKTPTL